MENLTEDQREIAKLKTMLDVCRRDKDALRYQLEEAKRKAAEQSMHLTLGILRTSQAFSHALAFFWLDGFAVPAPAQVTQTVGQFLAK